MTRYFVGLVVSLALITWVMVRTLPAADAAPGAGAADGFVPLLHGNDMAGMKLAGVKPETFTVKDGVVACTGQPTGYFRTEKAYRNFHLIFDIRYIRPEGLADDAKFRGNSGCLVHITGPDKVWPTCIEAQGMNAQLGELIPLSLGKDHKFAKDPQVKRQPAAVKPVGQWNTVEVVSRDGELTTTVNGTKMAQGKGTLVEGYIGFQSEGAPLEFRNLRIKPQ